VVEKASAEIKDTNHQAVGAEVVGDRQLAILDSNSAIQEQSSNRGYGSSTTAGPGGYPHIPQIVEHHHHHHHVHEAPAALKPSVTHVYNDNRTQVSGDQYNNHGTVNNMQMNGGQNFGTVNQQQNNNCDVLTGDLQQQLHLHQHQQVEHHQHLALPPNQHNPQLQIQDSASSPLLMIEDRGSNLEQAGPPQQLLLGAPPLAPADQQQPAPVRQDQSLLGKAGNSGQSAVAESTGINSAPSDARFAPRRATSVNRSPSHSRTSSSSRRKRGRRENGISADASSSTAGHESQLTEVSSSSDDDLSFSNRQGGEFHPRK
jgi:hypothetical protein